MLDDCEAKNDANNDNNNYIMHINTSGKLYGSIFTNNTEYYNN